MLIRYPVIALIIAILNELEASMYIPPIKGNFNWMSGEINIVTHS